jgi:hypothetical protein
MSRDRVAVLFHLVRPYENVWFNGKVRRLALLKD